MLADVVRQQSLSCGGVVLGGRAWANATCSLHRDRAHREQGGLTRPGREQACR